jgi:hypothetical protein
VLSGGGGTTGQEDYCVPGVQFSQCTLQAGAGVNPRGRARWAVTSAATYALLKVPVLIIGEVCLLGFSRVPPDTSTVQTPEVSWHPSELACLVA